MPICSTKKGTRVGLTALFNEVNIFALQNLDLYFVHNLDLDGVMFGSERERGYGRQHLGIIW